MLAPVAVGAAGDEAGHDGVRGVEAGGQVGDGDADFDGGAVAFAGDVHEAELGFDHDVVAGAEAVGARLAVAGYGGVDYAGRGLG